MESYQKIQNKLLSFIRKYYTNELIKGSILFVAFGLLYFLFTLYVEYFLWLKPGARTFLFWLFIGVEIGLLLKYILFPIFKLIGFYRGLSLKEASKIIGRHFPEVDDKLLNLLQLQEQSLTNNKSELILASIHQKSESLHPIPFQKAINFSGNTKYLKYLAIPLFIWLLTLLSGKNKVLKDSYTRVINHQQVYTPPAPFVFKLENKMLQVIEGESIQLEVKALGDILPEAVKIVYNDEDYYTNNKGNGEFSYTLEHLNKELSFYFISGKVQSDVYTIKVVPTPKIQAIKLQLNYPSYTNKTSETIENTGNVIVPTGTQIIWRINTDKVDSLFFSFGETRQAFIRDNNRVYKFSQKVTQSFPYKIQASNQYLQNYENLAFQVEVIQDEYPRMEIKTDIDSIQRGEAQFFGHLSDDYGISKLQLVYFNKNFPEEKMQYNLKHNSGTIVDFYYIFPRELTLKTGVDYAFYFEVFDNDRVHGAKSVKSKTYSYHINTQTEEQEKILEEQKQQLEDFQKTLNKQGKNRQDLEKLKKELQNKSNIEFNDTKKLENFIKRQEEYQQMMQRQTQELERNLDELPETNNQELQDKKEDIKKRMQEAKELEKQEKLLEELRKMAEKLNREELLDKIEKMSKNNKQKEKSLEQLLELTKRFYVEQKAQQIIEKLQELSKKQEKLAESEKNNRKEQDKLNKEFKAIQKDMQNLQKENKKLKEPMDIDEQKPEQEAVKKDQESASENLEQQKKQAARKKQKSAAEKMKQMAQGMQMQMAAGSQDMIEEDIAMLRQIIENLINFSYRQEDLMQTLDNMHKDHPDFPKKLKEQNRLKGFFEHIDDSLYVLALRQPKLSQRINEPLADAHYHLDKSLENFESFSFQKAVADQHFVMKSANDLALLLSRLLDNMQSSMKMGQGKGQGMGMGKGQGQGKGFSLPDIIKKQGELSEQMKQGMKKGDKPGGKKEGDKGKDGKTGDKGKKGKKGLKGENGSGKGGQGNGEQESQELYEIYKQQARLRQALEQQLQDMEGGGIKAQANLVKKQMEDLERMLLEKGITQQVLDKMLRIDHELLKLKNAAQMQGKEEKRESKTNIKTHPKLSPKQLEFKEKYYRRNEILNREVLPFKSLYRKKVQEYFKEKDD